MAIEMDKDMQTLFSTPRNMAKSSPSSVSLVTLGNSTVLTWLFVTDRGPRDWDEGSFGLRGWSCLILELSLGHRVTLSAPVMAKECPPSAGCCADQVEITHSESLSLSMREVRAETASAA